MGSVQFGIPRALTLLLKEKYGLQRFVETGTLVGHTALWASEHFKSVVTVDIFQQCGSVQNIETVNGDSAEFLEGMTVAEPTLFWLDAHTNESCPVLREIAAVNKLSVGHVIMVDDARLFGDLPAWPTLAQVCEALHAGGRSTEIIEDVIVAVPCP